MSEQQNESAFRPFLNTDRLCIPGGDAVSPRHAAVPAGSPHHPSPRFGGSWGHGNGAGAGFSGAAFRSQSTPDAHTNGGGGGGGGGWDRNGDVVRVPNVWLQIQLPSLTL